MDHCQFPRVITVRTYPEQVSNIEVNWQDNEQRCKIGHTAHSVLSTFSSPTLALIPGMTPAGG